MKPQTSPSLQLVITLILLLIEHSLLLKLYIQLEMFAVGPNNTLNLLVNVRHEKSKILLLNYNSISYKLLISSYNDADY